MEITGTVVSLLPMQSGQGKNGTWKKQEFIIETPGQYPKKVCLSLWGEKVDETRIAVGEKITASINIESREYNGRWYTSIKAWKIEKNAVNATPAASQAASVNEPATSFTPFEAGNGAENGSDLPF